MPDDDEKTPKYLSREPDDPIRLAMEAKIRNAEARAELTPRQQELAWGKEKYIEIATAVKYAKRRTMLGWILNTKEVTVQEKHKMCDGLQALVDFCRNSIPTEGTGKAAADEIATPLD